MPLFEVVGNALMLAPEHTGATDVKVGVMFAFTLTLVALDVVEQLFASVTTTEYEPAAFAV